jgi:hypothetical protein
MYCIGIDQSYTNTGIAVTRDGVLVNATSHKPKGKNKAEKRLDLYSYLINVVGGIEHYTDKDDACFVYERIRMYSKGFVSMPYIIATAALCGTIQEVAHELKIPCYSVDTRAWKKAVIGSVAKQQNEEKVQPEKYPTVLWARANFDIGNSVVDTDMCDAIAISQTWWKCNDMLRDEMK